MEVTLSRFTLMKFRLLTRAACFLCVGLLFSGYAYSQTCSQMDLGNVASLNGFLPFSNDPANAWNTNIANAPVDPNSAAIIAAIPTKYKLHPDFGPQAGIPYVIVDSTQTPSVTMVGASTGTPGPNATQSDAVVEPAPISAPIEGSQPDCVDFPSQVYLGDTHMLVVDRNKCWAYETYLTSRCNGVFAVGGQTIWNLQDHEQRPWGWTSQDAAGLSVFAGLVKYDEATNGVKNPANPNAAGFIQHAFRFTMSTTKGDGDGGYFVPPATHAAAPGSHYTSLNVMGMRLRLKSDAATNAKIATYSPINQSILTAMQQYGLILADNGSNMYVSGTTDPRWNTDDLGNWHGGPNPILPTDFEVVQMTPEAVDTQDGTTYPASQAWSYLDANSAPYTVEDVESGTYPGGLGPEGTALTGGAKYPVPGVDTAGAAPTINSFTASATTLAHPGDPVTFTYSVSNDSYDYIDMIGPVRLTANGGGAGVNTGSITINPTLTQTYTLNSLNASGLSQSGQAYALPLTGNAPPSITVTVAGSVLPLPVLSPATGTYSTIVGAVIELPGYPQAQIYYTTDESTPTYPPTGTTQLYTGPITITNTTPDPVTYLSGEEVQAIAVVPGFAAPSPLGSAVYVVNSTAPAPVITPASGTFTTTQTVTIADAATGIDNNGAIVYYTTDGTQPQGDAFGDALTNSTQVNYTSPGSPFTFTVAGGTTTVNAIAIATGYSMSPVTTAVYNLPVSFTVAAAPGTLSLAPASTGGSIVVSVTSQNGFSSGVTLGCSGLPAGATCSFSPATVTPTATTAGTSTLTVHMTPGAIASVRHDRSPLFPGASLGVALCLFGLRKRRTLQMMLLFTVSLVGMGVFTGCSAGISNTIPTTTTITVTGTSGTVQSSTTFTILQ